jgi:outer membrane protein TolC
MPELSVEVLVEQVLARNPSLAQMVAAWQAAAARYPQVTSLDDPMFGATIGPASVGSRDVDFAYRVEVSQKYPWPGKLALRGQNALAEAQAAGGEVEDMRLQLAESARSAFADYYLVGRALAVNEETLKRLREFREAALALFRTPPRDRKVSYQDVLQADVEIGRRRERQLGLERMRQVAVARINTLLHLPPDSPLPPPPARVELSGGLPEAAALRAGALARRPDLRALADRVRAEQSALALACKEFYPDFEAMAAYDAFWQRPEQDLRPMLGVRLNLPVRQARRQAAVAEAEARVAQRRAELARLSDQVNFQVQEAYEQVRESEQVVRLYLEQILPDAEQNVEAARADYRTGQVPAVGVIEAERTRLGVYDRYYEALAEWVRRRAALERASGGPLVTEVPAAPARPAGVRGGLS